MKSKHIFFPLLAIAFFAAGIASAQQLPFKTDSQTDISKKISEFFLSLKQDTEHLTQTITACRYELTGMYSITNPGAFTVFQQISDFEEISTGEESYLPLVRLRECAAEFTALKDYAPSGTFCDGFSEAGFFCVSLSDTDKNSLKERLTNIISFSMETGKFEPLTEEQQKTVNSIILNSACRVIITEALEEGDTPAGDTGDTKQTISTLAYQSAELYFGVIAGKLYLFIIDITDCSA